MSFILDALKKSEIERQRQSVPGLMDAGPLPKRARFPAWAIALTVLLAVNLGVLVIVLTRSGPSGASGRRAAELRTAPATASAAAPATAPAAPTAPAPSTLAGASAGAPPPAAASPGAADSAQPRSHFSPMDAAPPVYAPEIPPGDEPSAAPGTMAPAATRAAHAPQSSVSHGRGRDPLLTDDDKSSTEVLPSMSELNLSGADALPELHIDVHVYATRPADRFVYINMRKYHEGDTLPEGPVLERIRRDGVVLDYRGLRFILPRQQ